MKAWKVWDENSWEGGSTIVFAETRGKAKAIAVNTDACYGARFIDISVSRLKAADKLYKGDSEIDWYDNDTRLALVRDFDWSCYETSFECDTCVARKYCNKWEDEE